MRLGNAIRFMICVIYLTLEKANTKIEMAMSASETSYNVELVFQLTEFFNSDLILLVRNDGNDKLLRKFFKFKTSRKALLGTLDMNENFEETLDKAISSAPYQNIMIISNFRSGLIERLICIQNHLPSIIASAIWINFMEQDNDSIRDLIIPLDSRFFILKKLDASTYEITDVYQISPNFSKIYSRFATWRNGELNAFKGYFYSRRMDLRGHQINISRPEQVTNTDPRKDIWEIFSQGMNFSLNRNFPAFGNFYFNGTKTGILKLIHDHVVGGTLPIYFYTKHRLDHFDYIFPTEMAESKLYFRTSTESNWSSYLRPFSTGIWMSIIFWIIIAAALMHTIVFKLNQFEKIEKRSFGDSIFDVMNALCSQAGKLKIHKASFYISYLMPYLLVVVLLQNYSGVLLSFLTVKIPVQPFNDFEGVIKDKSYKISVSNNTYALFYFETDTGELAKSIRTNNLLVTDEYKPQSYHAGFQQICENKWVFLCQCVDLVIKVNCDVFEMSSIIFNQPIGIIVWKGFPYKDVMAKMMRKLQLAGILGLKRRNTVLNYPLEIFSPISIEVVFPIILLYLIAVILSGIILLFEVKYASIFLK